MFTNATQHNTQIISLACSGRCRRRRFPSGFSIVVASQRDMRVHFGSGWGDELGSNVWYTSYAQMFATSSSSLPPPPLRVKSMCLCVGKIFKCNAYTHTDNISYIYMYIQTYEGGGGGLGVLYRLVGYGQ